MSLPSLEQSFVVGSIQTSAGPVPRIADSLTRADYWGTFKVRWGLRRMHYTIDPGLYALGHPNDKSPVLVTANYKMSFDQLRKVLSSRNVWVLALDTKGVNVWCSAGKGTFGTEEIIRRITATGLDRIVSHRELILPQLAAPGVAAHHVKKQSGFKVIYGPIRADHLPAFLDSGLKATPEMRRKSFTLWERVVLIPVELVGALKGGLLLFIVLFLIGLFGGSGGLWVNTRYSCIYSAQIIITGMLAGAVFTPLLLPWLPGRAFSVKGLAPGILGALFLMVLRWGDWTAMTGAFEMIAGLLLILAASTFLAMNFTGASTYTSLSGVKKEMRWAVPLQAGSAALGFLFFIVSRFIA